MEVVLRREAVACLKAQEPAHLCVSWVVYGQGWFEGSMDEQVLTRVTSRIRSTAKATRESEKHGGQGRVREEAEGEKWRKEAKHEQ